MIKHKFADFRKKLEVWKKTDKRRVKDKTKFERRTKALFTAFKKAKENFTYENEGITEIGQKFDDFADSTRKGIEDEKTMNDFLCNLNEAQVYNISELDRLVQTEVRSASEKEDVLREFVQHIKKECIMNEHYFTFHSLPEMIVKKKYKKTTYLIIKKLLLNVKQAYLQQKQMPSDNVEAPKNTKEEQERAASGVITEEDMVDVLLLDEEISRVQKKFSDKRELWEQFITACRQEADKKQKDLSADTQKTKNLIEQYVFATYLNDKLEERHAEVFTKNYQLNLMNFKFVTKGHMLTTADDFMLMYESIQACTTPVHGNRFREEYLQWKEAEMEKFTGKVAIGDDENKSQTSFT